MLDQNACCFVKSGGRPHRSQCSAVLRAFDGSAGAATVVELVGELLMVVMALFQKRRASVPTFIRHWFVAVCTSASESLPNTVVASSA